MTDKELIFKIQNDKDQDCLVELFDECLPGLHKVAHKLKSPTLKEDFMQEVWIVFLETVKKVDLDRVDDNWKFVYFLWTPVEYLRVNMNHRFSKKLYKESEYDLESALESAEIHQKVSDYIRYDINSYEYEKYSVDKTIRSSEEYLLPKVEKFSQYIEELNPVYPTILELKQKGFLHKEIQEMVGMTRKQIHTAVANMRKVASYVFETTYQHEDARWVEGRLNIVNA